ncbi:MAG: ATP synthase F1 subunit epsilon [Candidatus Magasanikbacteria bacterium RIFCSPHIGHO2_01_FULL_47_8]|uniref:ATP synthase epsilon chain n=1 Tax=Candidatus Magasanikbacteria bacterium RIFCSPHIGHO2_01_FULL_47_8 TaxID=1798673 RepID=A0A1F6MAL4_9BACT|nr:MAG: ATP synthase F1 subunit epsilon [Candidatus Magasanikbacteria bacterium RIFCSPHIGHO2_01_FULL_47_8]
MPKLKLKIVTPEKVLLDAEADSVSCPTQMGEITILPNHIPLVASLAPGEMKIVENGSARHMAVAGGVVEVRRQNEIVVLADAAEAEEEIDIKRAEEAKARARKVMAEKTLSEEEYAATAAALEKALTRLRVARRKRH